MSKVLAVTEAVAESDQDRSRIIVVVTPKKDFHVPRNAAEHVRARGGTPNQQLRRLQWSVEEVCKFASAEVVVSKN